jgi:hypothetical protein
MWQNGMEREGRRPAPWGAEAVGMGGCARLRWSVAGLRSVSSASLRADAGGRLRASSKRMRLRDEHRGLAGAGM